MVFCTVEREHKVRYEKKSTKVQNPQHMCESDGIITRNYWRAKRANLVVLCARFFSLSLSLYIYIYIYIFPGQCHTVISNLAITRIILNPFYNAAVYTAYSEPTMHCIHLVMMILKCNCIIKVLQHSYYMPC